jgi:uncharacterized ParB-like nuclease family protein
MANMTAAEKKRQIVAYLRDPLTAPNPDATIARYFGVTRGFVAKLRAEVEAEGTAFQKGSLHEIPIAAIRRDGGTQPRAALDRSVAREYRDELKAGAIFPPVSVVYDGSDYWLWDGFHRHEAHEMAGRQKIMAEVRQGTRRDAVLLAAGANSGHGLRRSNDDKRRAVEYLLRDPAWQRKTDNWIAGVCHVSHPFVGKMRDELGIPTCNVTSRENSNGRTIDVSNIGRASTNGHASPPDPPRRDPLPDQTSFIDDEPEPEADPDDVDEIESTEDDCHAEPDEMPEPPRPPDPPMAGPVVIDTKVSITLIGNADQDAKRFLAGYPKGEARRFLRLLGEAMSTGRELDDQSYNPEPRSMPPQTKNVLDRLRQGPATNRELATISLKYTGRISDLRALGCVVVCDKDRSAGISVYTLKHEPEWL